MARTEGEASTGATRSWSVRAHLVVIVAVVLTVFLGLGAVLGQQTWRTAERTTRTNATYFARVGADALADSAAVARDQAIAIAANPSVAPLFEDSAACTFDFQLELFPDSHLDLVRPNGEIVCSSHDDGGAGASHTGAGWLDRTDEGTISQPFVDGVTGQSAVAFVADVAAPGGTSVGSVAIVIPTRSIAQPVADVFGGPRRFQFALVDASTSAVVSVSEGLAVGDRPSGSRSPHPMQAAGFLYSERHVEGTNWTVLAGVDPDIALSATRSVLLRGALLGAVVLVVLLGALGLVARRIARPVRELTRAVQSIGPHVDGMLAAIEGPTEVAHLAAAFRKAASERDIYEAQLSHQALHDPLTGLPNRALLTERLDDAVKLATDEDATVAVVFLDLDRFKLVNDSLGHVAGDRVLIETAARLRDLVPVGGTLARFGGDEFVVVTSVSSDGELERLVGTLLAAVDDPVEVGGTIVRVTASIGIATSAPGRRPADLLRDADNAMYSAKEHGRARAVRFSDRLHDNVSARLTLASEFRVALERGELHLEYQPKVCLATGAIEGVEALLRWDHPALGSVPPSTFIPIAEETDAILAVGEFVLDEACRQASAWRAGGIDLTMAVNLSGRQLLDVELCNRVTASLLAAGLAPERLYLELTESMLMHDTITSQRTVDALHDLGVRLSIDDFGTGYSSLAYLHRFPVDELKIDRSFVAGLTVSSDRSQLVAAMIAMSKALGLATLAEGVETPEQAARLRALGCDSAQGYLFARPQTAEALAPLLPRRNPSPAESGVTPAPDERRGVKA